MKNRDRPIQLDLLAEIGQGEKVYPNLKVGDWVTVDKAHPMFNAGFPNYLDGVFRVIEKISDRWMIIEHPESKLIHGIPIKILNFLHPECQFSLIVKNFGELVKPVEKVRVHCRPERIKSPSIHYEIKEIKGRFYRYQRWWDGDRHRSKYLGTARATN